MKKLILMGLLLMGMMTFAQVKTPADGTIISDNSRLSRPLMISLFADYGNR